MHKPVLHYIHDPLCGWCYAAEPMAAAVVAAGIPVVLHGGGLWDTPTQATPTRRRQIRDADERIGALTGQPFGTSYLDGLLADRDTIWHSRPTIAAILAAESLSAGSGPRMLTAIQSAHYVDGCKVIDDGVLASLAGRIGLDEQAFGKALRDAPVDRHVQDTRVLMERYGLGAFPSFLVERDGVLARLSHEAFYGRPDAFAAAVLDPEPSATRSA